MALEQMKGNIYEAARSSGGRRQIILPNSTMCEVCERFKVDDPDYIRLPQGLRFAGACVCERPRSPHGRCLGPWGRGDG